MDDTFSISTLPATLQAIGASISFNYTSHNLTSHSIHAHPLRSKNFMATSSNPTVVPALSFLNGFSKLKIICSTFTYNRKQYRKLSEGKGYHSWYII